MAGPASRYDNQEFYSAWLRSKKGSHRADRHFLKFLVILAMLVAVIAVSTAMGGSRDLKAPPMAKNQNVSDWKAGRRLMQADRPYEENEGVECFHVYSYDSGEDQCKFVTVTKDCTNDVKFLNYVDFVFCKTKGALKPVGTIICILWWLFCFIGLAVTADDFFCPSLVVISKVLHLSPNIAGVTFLAFGNGSPDVFSAIAALSTGGDPALGLGGLLGAGVFVTTVVAGTISVVTPFTAMQRPFIRDVIFYIVGVYWTFTVLWRGYIYVFESIGYISLYGIYVVIVATSGSIYRKQQANKKNAAIKMNPMVSKAIEEEQRNSLSNSRKNSRVSEQQPERRLSIDDEIELKNLSRKVSQALAGSQGKLDVESGDKADEHQEEEEEQERKAMLKREEAERDRRRSSARSGGDEGEDEETDREPETPMQQFLGAINPINMEEWSEMGIVKKVYEIAKAPIYFAITLTCPVVNYEEEESHNWCRYLQILQLVTAPVSVVFLVRFGGKYIGGVIPFWAVALLIGVGLAVACFLTSKHETRPAYHDAFGFIGFIMGIIWIYTLANEIVSLLKTFGIIFNINDAILGLTLLAWGNSLGDWISDTVMARQGFARMGFSACFGGPFFNLSIGFGGAMMISQIVAGDSIRYGLNMNGPSLVLISFLMLSLCFSLIFVVFILRFKVQRVYGLCLLILYVTFVLTAVLAAVKVILDF